MIERWPIFLLGRNPQKQYGLVSWLESAQLYNTVIIFLEKGVKSHLRLDVAMAHDLRLTAADPLLISTGFLKYPVSLDNFSISKFSV